MEADRALEYWDKALGILEAIRREELPKLVEAAREAAKRKKAGGKGLWMYRDTRNRYVPRAA